MSDEQDKQHEFTVKDKDKDCSTPDGQTKEEGPQAEDNPPQQEEAQDQGAPEQEQEPQAQSAPLPNIDFSTFILSLSTSVLVHLGEAAHPDGAKHKDLALAKQTIDILGLLKEKTGGNLTDEEQELIDNLLYDLRLRYISASS